MINTSELKGHYDKRVIAAYKEDCPVLNQTLNLIRSLEFFNCEQILSQIKEQNPTADYEYISDELNSALALHSVLSGGDLNNAIILVDAIIAAQQDVANGKSLSLAEIKQFALGKE